MACSGHQPQADAGPAATVAAVIERFAPAFWQRYGDCITVDQRRALQNILQCRTEALGGHRYECACGHTHHAYHSCNHRLCPRCGAADTQAWVAGQLDKLLPVPYYLVTFTLPSPLHALVHQNRLALNAFMQCSAQALRELLADPKRCAFHRSGFFGVYQSWTQDLRLHPHVHYIVPAVGLDDHWQLKRTKQRKFLIHAQALANRLRTLLINQLCHQKLLTEAEGHQLRQTSWNASVDPAGQGHNAVKYLGQYVRHSVIRDGRIVAVDDTHVTFRTKDRDTGQPQLQRLEGVEFLRRYLQHVLPCGFHRIRYYGYLHPQGKPTLQWLQLILEAQPPKTDSAPTVPGDILCPHCGSPMQRTARLARAPPPWRNADFHQRIAA